MGRMRRITPLDTRVIRAMQRNPVTLGAQVTHEVGHAVVAPTRVDPVEHVPIVRRLERNELVPQQRPF